MPAALGTDVPTPLISFSPGSRPLATVSLTFGAQVAPALRSEHETLLDCHLLMNEIAMSLMIMFIAVVFAFGVLWQDNDREKIVAPGSRASDE